MTRESADARHMASVMMLCFTTLSGTLVALFSGSLVAWAFPLVLGVLTIAHAYEDFQTTDPQPGVGE